MISMLGQLLVMVALLCATVGMVTGFAAGRSRSTEAWQWTRLAALGFSGSMIAANLLMVYALVTLDFSVAYVAEVGSHATPIHIRVISLWASLNGSILFWGGVLAMYTGLLTVTIGERYREYMPWTLHVLLGIAVFFTFLVASIADPFALVDPVPTDGPGPNPLLQNHWLMAIHPPTLYLGYVGMSVPFSMICAALLAGRLEAGWMEPVRRWMLIPWTFLAVGIVLGGWWSYAVLGWGGAWAWDPVENASFHPFLTGTAFLHSAMVLQRRNQLRDWTLVLGMATFLLTLVGTFMTRSGVFNSVHSFTQSDIGPVFLVFIAATLLYSVVLLAFRSHTLDDAAGAVDAELGRKRAVGAMDRLLSREFSILVQNALFTVFTFLVLLGTLYPLVTEAFESRQVSVGEPYFDRWALPLGLAITFMMGVGPALPWGRMSPEAAKKRFIAPVIAGVVVAAAFAAMGFVKPYTLLALFLCGFAAVANIGEFITPLLVRMRSRGEPVTVAARTTFSRTRRRFGGHVAHYGVILAVMSLALSKGYKIERDYSFAANETHAFEGWDLTFMGAVDVDETFRTSRKATFMLSRDGSDIGVLEPRMNYYRTQREPIFTPAVHSRPTGDLYFSILELAPDGKNVVVRLMSHPYQVWLWIAAAVIALGSLISLWPAGRREVSAAASAPSEQAAK
ncbi:MAG: cytochrome c-type biogenesis protein CcmF [Myxococcota bacterium]|jgi:cytochrome c-type biogenesis protein CcmF